MKDYLRDMVARRKQGEVCGIGSYCTANELVIEACMQRARRDHQVVLLEATANQVNQFGGYTGMRPADFRDFVYGIADRIGFPREDILLGGDHLGPLTWLSEPEDRAMDKAAELVRLFVLAGFKKIHLDTSMRLADDPRDRPLTDETIARRGARLYAACEDAYQTLRAGNLGEIRPVYIVGSEVPIPGGAQEAESSIAVTRPEALNKTVETYRAAFAEAGCADGFENVIGVVVQPGVEFGDADFFRYDRANAKELTAAAKKLDGIVLEGHSTDYQPAEALREMVEDGIAILKVGPALTFGLREGLFALDMMEKILLPEGRRVHFADTLERVMLEHPENWKKYYHGDELQQAIKRKFSFSDRIRYYLTDAEVKTAMDQLIARMQKVEIPLSMLHQYMPLQYTKVRDGRLPMDARELVKDCVLTFAEDYSYATR
ncbi:tagatose 6-phosphate aldolase subunit Z [Oscillibacter valericigenes Sjm18-20]|nr:tagatose 6-phosphate aldolase subunit Z [Oscillibacter valericigenes Sjm18-20]